MTDGLCTREERLEAALRLIASGQLRATTYDGLATYACPPNEQAAYMRGIAQNALNTSDPVASTQESS